MRVRLTRPIKRQLVAFAVIATASVLILFIGYLRAPAVYLGVGRYTVTIQMPDLGGAYEGSNVTYRGVEIGRVEHIRLTPNGSEAELSLRSNIEIPRDVRAEIHSMSAVGEQYVQLMPLGGDGPSLADGDVITADRTSVPPNINALLSAANRGLDAIPHDDLKTVIDESYLAVGGLGPELSRLVDGTTKLATDARQNLDSITNLIDNSKPLLDSQTNTSDSVQAWAANLAEVTQQLHDHDDAVRGVLNQGPEAVDQTRQLVDRLAPTLPVVLANLVSIGQVAVTYRDNLEALLVLLPRGAEYIQSILLPNQGTKQDYAGGFLSFNLNLNLPAPCQVGFYPIQQMRNPAFVDSPERPEGLTYCRIPQDAHNDVRGLRNLPCVTRPGKRAPTVKMCESDEEYVPLNDGYNWKGDPNATYTGQGVPQFDPGEAPPPAASAPPPPPGSPTASPPTAPAGRGGVPAGVPPISVAEYDPATGSYIGPDGKVYTQADLARGNREEKTWQQMLIPPEGG